MCRKKSYDELFPNILKIGMENINSGISYLKLKQELEKKKYVFGDTENSCKESTIENWFWDNFSHCDCVLSEKEQKDAQDENGYLFLEKHSKCGCIINGNACLTYLEYKNAKNSKEYCKWAVIIASIAFLFSIFGNCLINFIKSFL
jgi:hypothetical protein